MSPVTVSPMIRQQPTNRRLGRRALLLGVLLAVLGLAIPWGPKPSSGGPMVAKRHLVLGFNSEYDCGGKMVNFEPLVELGSVEIDGHRFEFEVRDAEELTNVAFRWLKGIGSGPGVYVFDEDGQLEYAMQGPYSHEEVLAHLGQVATGVTLPNLAKSMQGDSADLDLAFKYSLLLSYKSDGEGQEFRERIRSLDPLAQSEAGALIQFWELMDSWGEEQGGLSREEISFRPPLDFLERHQGSQLRSWGYHILARLATRLERPGQMRQFYSSALEGSPKWMRTALIEEAKQAGVRLGDQSGLATPQHPASAD